MFPHKISHSSQNKESTEYRKLAIITARMMKGVPNYLVALAIIALACSVASAYDPAPLQDFCVAVNTSTDAGIYTLFFLLLLLLLCSHLKHLGIYRSM
jgi:hypothetical protein